MLIPSPYAMDIGDRTVKVAQLVPQPRWRAGGPMPRMRFLIERDLEEGWVTRGAIADLVPLATFLRRVIHERVPSLSRSPFVVASLPEQRMFCTTVTVADRAKAERGAALHRAVREVVPLDIQHATVATTPLLGTTDHVAVAAAPTALVETYAGLFERVGLTPIALVTESEALAHAVAFATDRNGSQTTRHSSLGTLHSSPVLILDLGATRTGAIIANGPSVAASITIPVSGQQLTAAIAAKLRIDPAAAERAKRSADLSRTSPDDPTATALMQALEPIIAGIASLRAFALHHLSTSLQPTRIVLTGGGSGLAGLDTFLHARCKLDVTTFALPTSTAPSVPGRPAVPTSHLALVFGLGLMALDPVGTVTT